MGLSKKSLKRHSLEKGNLIIGCLPFIYKITFGEFASSVLKHLPAASLWQAGVQKDGSRLFRQPLFL
jgi:hypothetical protein